MPKTAAKYGTYGPVFSALLSAAAAPVPLSDLATLTYHDVVEGGPEVYPPLDEIDAILITGSKWSAYESDPWIERLVDYTRAALQTTGKGAGAAAGAGGARQGAVRVIGVCFGHQIVSRALGLPVRRSPLGWEVSVTPIKLTPRGREVFFSRAPARNDMITNGGTEDTGDGEGCDKSAPLRLQQMHRDEVVGLPEGAEPLGATDLCVTQGFLLPGRAITVQGHPEFTEEIVREILEVRHEIGVFDDEVFRSGLERVGRAHDGVEVARAFLRFLKE